METAVVNFYKNDRVRINRVFLFTFLFGFIAHGYCMFNTNFSHDSLFGMYYGEANTMEHLSVGRLLRPVYCIIKGNLSIPVINVLLMLIFLSVSIYLIVLLLEIRSGRAIALTAGILVSNYSMTLLSATYLHDVDCYMFALMLSLVGLYFLEKEKLKYSLLSILFFTASISLYQAYVNVVVTLILIKTMKEIRCNADVLDCLKKLVLKGICVGASMVLYFVIYKIVLLILKTSPTDPYNVPNTDFLTRNQLLDNLRALLGREIKWLIKPRNHHIQLVALMNIVLFVILAYAIINVLKDKRIRVINKAAYVVILCLVPFGLNILGFLVAWQHELMFFSFFLVYVIGNDFVEKHLPKKTGLFAAILVMVIIVDNCIYANTAYLKKDLEAKNTLSTVTRVIDRIEQVDEYVPGETPVMFVGRLFDSPLGLHRDFFDYDAIGLTRTFSATNEGTLETYLISYLAYPINFVYFSEEWGGKPEIQEMPSFPKNGSCRMIDDVLVVKLAEPVSE